MKGRIKRGKGPKGPLTQNNYRKMAFPHLMRDFGDRCAYSLVHVNKICGDDAMEVDHHNPTLKGQKRHKYTNLFPAIRHCNNEKSDHWPTRADRRKGYKFLNCCHEQDYNHQIFEDPETHELVATTPAAHYHIRKCDLNADFLVNRRAERAEKHASFKKAAILKAPIKIIESLVKHLRNDLSVSIPPINPPPKT